MVPHHAQLEAQQPLTMPWRHSRRQSMRAGLSSKNMVIILKCWISFYCWQSHMAIYSVHVQFEALSQGSILGKDLYSGPVNQMHISIHFDFVDRSDSDESLVMDDQQPGMMTCELSNNRLTIRNAFSPQTSTFSGCTGQLCL